MAIESDVPNPDGRLMVKFYSKPVQNEFQTNKEGRPIFEDVDFVKIFIPGDTLSTIDAPARADHKARFPLHWAAYQNAHGADSKIMGTPVEHWPLITALQAEELKAIKFFTVESVANASDLQLQGLGMKAGMSPFAFRDRAKNFLRVASQESAVNQNDEELEQLRGENKRMKAESISMFADMQAQMDVLKEIIRAKPGRKPKVLEVA